MPSEPTLRTVSPLSIFTLVFFGVHMLTITAAQMQSLNEMCRRNFDKQLSHFLRAEFADKVSHLTPEQMNTICDRVVLAAEELGIAEAVPTAQLACLAIATQGKILTNPDVRACLADTGLPPQERMQALVDELSATA